MFLVRGRRRKHDRRRRDRIVRPVMLAQAEHVEPDLVGKLDLLNQVLQPLRRAYSVPGLGVGADIAERVETEFHAAHPAPCH
jgi:hypothetical protein